MQRISKKSILAISLAASLSMTFASDALAQGGQPVGQTSMTLYQVVTDNSGQQYIVTKAGPKLPLPGAGLPPGTQQVAIYRDQANNYWYTDRNGRPVEISAQQLQSYLNKLYASQGQGSNNNNNSSNSSNSSSGRGLGALGTGLAAAGGAAAGAAITNSYYNNNDYYHGVPYGVPIYRAANNQPYYVNTGGNQVYVNNSVHNSSVMNQWNQQGNWDNRNQWSNQAAAQQAKSAKESTGRFRNRGADKENDGGGRLGGRFGRGEDGQANDGNSGGRLGGRFGNRDGNNQQGAALNQNNSRLGGGNEGGRFGGSKEGGGRLGGGAENRSGRRGGGFRNR